MYIVLPCNVYMSGLFKPTKIMIKICIDWKKKKSFELSVVLSCLSMAQYRTVQQLFGPPPSPRLPLSVAVFSQGYKIDMRNFHINQITIPRINYSGKYFFGNQNIKKKWFFFFFSCFFEKKKFCFFEFQNNLRFKCLSAVDVKLSMSSPILLTR